MITIIHSLSVGLSVSVDPSSLIMVHHGPRSGDVSWSQVRRSDMSHGRHLWGHMVPVWSAHLTSWLSPLICRGGTFLTIIRFRSAPETDDTGWHQTSSSPHCFRQVLTLQWLLFMLDLKIWNYQVCLKALKKIVWFVWLVCLICLHFFSS